MWCDYLWIWKHFSPTIKTIMWKVQYSARLPSYTVITRPLNWKRNIKSAGTKVVPFISVKESTDIDKAIETLGYPFIVKTRFGGYDGKGQVLINNEKDLQEGFKLIETSECVAEKYLNIKKEVSLTVTRGNNNQITFSHYKKMSIEIKYFSKQLFQRE